MEITKTTEREKLYRISILREESRTVGDARAHYYFCASRFARPEYYAEVLYQDERAATLLGTDYPQAQILFDAIVNGTVTPCTLEDVVTDMKNIGTPLYK